MLYTDPLFLVLFAGLWLAGKALQPWPAIKEWMLIAFSFLVIATWGIFDLEIFLVVLVVNYAGSILISRRGPGRSRAILAAFIALDVGTLAVFKYANFFGSNFRDFTGLAIPNFPLGIPIAISFYTFHLISYLVDLHAGRVRLAGIRGYVFYLSFFPHVIAGPIVRAWQLVPQIGKTRRLPGDLPIGIHFLITGFFLKMVVANNIAEDIDDLWPAWLSLKPDECWILAFLYYCQIYGDFAGYSLMALGMARLLGYRLPANFRSPLRALTLQEFWHRWHITLSRWLRDYLYIPLGGNHGSRLASARNVAVTMLLGGLWHGAGWGFIYWGALHGAGLVIERLLGMTRKNRALPSRLAWGFIVQLWVIAAWVYFRMPQFDEATRFLCRMLSPSLFYDFGLNVKLLIALIFSVPVIAHNLFPLLIPKLSRTNLAFVLGLSTAVMLLLNFIIVSPSTVFIYFRF
jgi:alginate O-acetyltransferase complex protein AlgI